MNDWFETLIVLSVAGSTVVTCILVLNLISKNAFTAKWQYLVRKLALLFFIVPAWFGSQSLSLIWVASNGSSTVMQADYWREELYIPIEWAILILSVWGVGAVIFLGWHIYCYSKFTKEIRNNNITVPADHGAYKLLNDCKKMLRIRRDIEIAYNDKIASPALIGLLNPTILLPTKEMSPVELSMVLHHELIHFKRKDLWVKLLMLVVSTLHWYNPFVHILRKEIHIWSEFSCDGEVVAEMSHAERKQYGEMILNMLEDSIAPHPSYSAFLSENKENLKKRLTMMLHIKKIKTPTLLMISTIISVGVIGMAASALASDNTPVVESIIATEAIFDSEDQKKKSSSLSSP